MTTMANKSQQTTRYDVLGLPGSRGLVITEVAAWLSFFR